MPARVPYDSSWFLLLFCQSHQPISSVIRCSRSVKHFDTARSSSFLLPWRAMQFPHPRCTTYKCGTWNTSVLGPLKVIEDKLALLSLFFFIDFSAWVHNWHLTFVVRAYGFFTNSAVLTHTTDVVVHAVHSFQVDLGPASTTGVNGGSGAWMLAIDCHQRWISIGTWRRRVLLHSQHLRRTQDVDTNNSKTLVCRNDLQQGHIFCPKHHNNSHGL